MRISFVQLFLIVSSLSVKSQIVSDYDGNVYQTITIGNQTWMAENLRTTHYSNGIAIENGSGIGDIEWGDQSERFFYYDNDSVNSLSYGCLYTWYAAVNGTVSSSSNPSGLQGICPTEWHLPSNSEWSQLETQVGGENVAGTYLNPGGESGFNAEFGGIRNYNDPSGGNQYYSNLNSTAFYISSTESDPESCTLFIILYGEPETSHGYHNKCCGYSVRCLKDSQTTLINIENQRKVVFYPIPCKDNLYIDSNGIEIEKVTIYSFNGVAIKSGLLKGVNNNISVSDLDKGLYLVKPKLRNRSIYANY